MKLVALGDICLNSLYVESRQKMQRIELFIT